MILNILTDYDSFTKETRKESCNSQNLRNFLIIEYTAGKLFQLNLCVNSYVDMKIYCINDSVNDSSTIVNFRLSVSLSLLIKVKL